MKDDMEFEGEDDNDESLTHHCPYLTQPQYQASL